MAQPLRVVQLLSSLAPVGYVRQVAMLSSALARQPEQFDVHVCAYHPADEMRELFDGAGVPVTQIGGADRFDLPALRRCGDFLKRIDPHVLHCWTPSMNRLGAVSVRGHRSTRLVLSIRRPPVMESLLKRAGNHWALRRTDCVVVNHPRLVDEVSSVARSCEVISNGVEPAQCPAGGRAALCQELGVPDDALLVAVLGPLERGKRLVELIWAGDLLKSRGDPIHLLVIGQGPLRWRVERFARQMRMDDRVHLLGAHAAAPQIVACCDQLWHSSQQESISNGLLEAMAAGVPVVAGDTAAVRDVVVPGETGLLYPLGEAAQLARHSLALMRDAELRARLSAAARRDVLERYSAAAMAERYAKLYGSLAADFRGS